MEEKINIPQPVKTPTWKISEHVRDHGDDPYIVMMNERADSIIEESGFPEAFLTPKEIAAQRKLLAKRKNNL